MIATAIHPLTADVAAEAVFTSLLQPSDSPTAAQVRNAISATLGRCGPAGCADCVAGEYGDHPETAVVRMRWARALVASASATL
jgi:hypothetical protein